MHDALLAPLLAFRDMVELGGFVVTLIFAACLIMWSIVIERWWYFSSVLPRQAERLLATWEARTEHMSWTAHQVRKAMISGNVRVISPGITHGPYSMRGRSSVVGGTPADVEQVGFAADLAVFNIALMLAGGFIDEGLVRFAAASALKRAFSHAARIPHALLQPAWNKKGGRGRCRSAARR